MSPAATEASTQPAEKFGTFLGVYTPSVLTILGLIMYLRFGWVAVFLGLKEPAPGDEASYADRMTTLADALGTVVFVRHAGEFSGRLISTPSTAPADHDEAAVGLLSE